MSAIEIRNLSIRFDSKSVLENINLKVAPGEFVVILGTSGGGKSTLLKAVAHLLPLDSGEIVFSIANPTLGFVFQDANLLPWRNVEENLKLPFEIRGQAIQNVDEELDRVGLRASKKAYPHELSGGMKMRVSLARALVERPQILLFDEPLSALDETTRFALQEELRRLCQQLKVTVIFVTHSISEAVFMADRILILRAFLANKSLAQLSEEFKIALPAERNSAVRLSQEYLALVQQITQKFREHS